MVKTQTITPDWYDQGVVIDDPSARSGDFDCIVDSQFYEEAGLVRHDSTWRYCQVPIASFGIAAPTMDQYLGRFRLDQTKEAPRLHAIRKWIQDCSGPVAALEQNPLILTLSAEGIKIEDGLHRLALAKYEHGLTHVPALCLRLPHATEAHAQNEQGKTYSMHVRIKPVPFTQPHGEPTSPYLSVIQCLVNAINAHPALTRISPLIEKKHYPAVAFPDTKLSITLDLKLDMDGGLIRQAQLDPKRVLGAFLSHSDLTGQHQYPDHYCAVVRFDENRLLDDLYDERIQAVDPLSNQYDPAIMSEILTSFTHEIAHAVEFAEHSHGLTPHGVICAADPYEDEHTYEQIVDFDLDLIDVVTGRWIRDDMQDKSLVNIDLAIKVCEARVEAKGQSWLRDCFNPDVVGQVAIPLRTAFQQMLDWADQKMQDRIGLSRPRYAFAQ